MPSDAEGAPNLKSVRESGCPVKAGVRKRVTMCRLQHAPWERHMAVCRIDLHDGMYTHRLVSLDLRG